MNNIANIGISRRNFVAAAAAGAAAAGVISASAMNEPAFADTASDDKDASAQAETSEETPETINCSGIVVDPAAVTEVIYSDILIVGGGFAGLAAAAQAAENGDAAILIEGASVLGGNGQGVEGTFAVDSKFQQEQGIEVKKSIIMQEELGKPQWAVNGLFYKDLIERSAGNIEWVVEKGAVLSGLIDNYPIGPTAGKVNTFHWWQDGAAGTGYIPYLSEYARENGVDIRLNNRGLEFSYDEDGAIDGVYAQDAFGDIVNYKARAIIIATGGFANDPKRLVRHGFDTDELELVGTPGHYGDGINMTLAAGASEYTGVCYLKYNRIGHDYAVETFGPLWSAFCFGGKFLWVNENCERFVDEACALEVGNTISQSAPIHLQPHTICYSLFDSKVCQEQKDTWKDMADEWGDNLDDQLESLIEAGDDVWVGDSIEDLADQAGLDKDALKATVDEYNAACEAGDDDWFGKPVEYLAPIETAPFYLTKIHPTMEGPLGGVVIDRTFRPVLDAGGVMENVFVIGLDSMMLYRDVYPMDVPGSASAECLNGGRTSANEAHAIIEQVGSLEAPAFDPSDPRTNAKQVIMAVSDLLTTMDLGLTEDDSPATISMSDPTYTEFFDAVKQYKNVSSLDLTDCTVVTEITSVLSQTARADSQQYHNHYDVQSVEMTVNGVKVTYSTDAGITVEG